jgi:hypothetical protein
MIADDDLQAGDPVYIDEDGRVRLVLPRPLDDELLKQVHEQLIKDGIIIHYDAPADDDGA